MNYVENVERMRFDHQKEIILNLVKSLVRSGSSAGGPRKSPERTYDLRKLELFFYVGLEFLVRFVSRQNEQKFKRRIIQTCVHNVK